GDLMSYEGKFESYRKPTVEKVLEIQLTNLTIKIDEKMDELMDEIETSRIEGREEIRNDIQQIFKILGQRTQ
ncbi:5737_t:CDS:1, partial [Ambispora gerdemannii]